MAYAEVTDVEAGFRTLSEEEKALCAHLLEEAATVIDVYNQDAETERKRLVSCRMVRRQLDAGPGAAQTWTMSGGSVGELYLSKLEKKLLGVGDKIGARSPVEDLTV